jgi:hypothetical protein
MFSLKCPKKALKLPFRVLETLLRFPKLPLIYTENPIRRTHAIEIERIGILL